MLCLGQLKTEALCSNESGFRNRKILTHHTRGSFVKIGETGAQLLDDVCSCKYLLPINASCSRSVSLYQKVRRSFRSWSPYVIVGKEESHKSGTNLFGSFLVETCIDGQVLSSLPCN